MNPQLLTEITALIVQGGSLAMSLFLKLEPLLNLGPDEKTNIANAIAASDAADHDTLNRVISWMQANGSGVQINFTAPAPPALNSAAAASNTRSPVAGPPIPGAPKA